MMVGLPGDDETGAFFTAGKIADFSFDFVRIYPALVLSGSLLAIWFQKQRYFPIPLEQCVTLVKKLYLFFSKKKIPVIRMGLQASKNLEEGNTIMAGPYHPAFGHMVFSEIFLDLALSAIGSEKNLQNKITINVNPKSISTMRGLKNRNIKILKEKFCFKSVKIIPDPAIPIDKLSVAGIR